VNLLPSVVPQGRKVLIGALGLSVVLFILGELVAAQIMALLAAGFFYLFRDPERVIPPLPLAIVAPADARVVSITDSTDPYLQRESIRIDFQMGFFNAYSLRAPIEGQYKKHWQIAGTEEKPAHQFAFWVQTDECDDVVAVLYRQPIPGSLFLSIHTGERVGQGQRIGSLSYGARLSLYLPKTSRIGIEPGQNLKAGTDVVGELIRQSGTSSAEPLQ